MPRRLLALVLLFAARPAFDQKPETTPVGGDSAAGARLFETRCARCHGLKGTGGTGPALNRARLRHSADEESLITLIKDGVPGTEMTATWQMDDRELRKVAVYVRSLGRSAVTPLPGNPTQGQALYAKSDCAKCHAIKGQGGTLGPDLTEVGARRGAAHLRQVMLDPGSAKLVDSEGFLSFLNVQVATHDGRVVQGLRVNEDSFSIQLRDADNRLHSFEKSDLAETRREPASSVMPSYAKTFSGSEIDDLVAYLAGLRGEG
jgi:putative heme-binding domain-containing protein